MKEFMSKWEIQLEINLKKIIYNSNSNYLHKHRAQHLWDFASFRPSDTSRATLISKSHFSHVEDSFNKSYQFFFFFITVTHGLDQIVVLVLPMLKGSLSYLCPLAQYYSTPHQVSDILRKWFMKLQHDGKLIMGH